MTETTEGGQCEARAACEHFYASHCYRGMSIRLCMMCHEPDWDDFAEQLGREPAPGPLVVPAAEGATFLKVASMLGMDRPAPALGERSGGATGTPGVVLDEAVKAARAADHAWHEANRGNWGSVTPSQVRRLVEGAAPILATADRQRAEAAEAKLAEIHAYCRDECEVVNEGMRLTAIVRASDILAIIGSEEGSDVR